MANLIALIDDDVSFRTALFNSLCSLGFDVHDFSSANEFAADPNRSSYDCVVTDIYMPGMTGIELKKYLTRHGSLVPVIMVTGRREPELESVALSSGAAFLLRKPFTSDVLIDRIHRAIAP